MTPQQEQTVEWMWSILLQLPPNVRHDAIAALRERLERMPAVLVNDAVMVRNGAAMQEEVGNAR